MNGKLFCPLCGYPLSILYRYDGETLLIDIGCEGEDDDEFMFYIKIPLTQKEIDLFETGDVITKKAVIEVIAVRPEPDYARDMDDERE